MKREERIIPIKGSHTGQDVRDRVADPDLARGLGSSTTQPGLKPILAYRRALLSAFKLKTDYCSLITEKL
ncbi:MAG: hypothetical protein U5K71_13105 [Gracilimonas sp.]|nr:hypothetical protein [Gracilimonas sp.]